SLGGYAGAVLGYRAAADFFGKAAATSFAWSVSALLLAILISAHKATWLPPRLLPRWRNGNHPDAPPAASMDLPDPTGST
ncbi:MAG: hypothetical protein JNG89_19520, partial [Planctomycetaceae bacterium]|nr:hypothetical protein [Planctomycetaceae bacterium]